MSVTLPPMDSGVEMFLRIFFPQYFDPESPHYVDPDTLLALSTVATEARPWCLSDSEQDMAQAFFTAYLVGMRQETSSGSGQGSGGIIAGPITSEKEGDITITYATSQSGASTVSKRPATDPWDAWNRLWGRCAKAGIITRFGDPCQQQSSQSLTATLVSNVLKSI